jgi:hypothetical protein
VRPFLHVEAQPQFDCFFQRPRSSIYLSNEQGTPFVISGAREYPERDQLVLHVRGDTIIRRGLSRRQDPDANSVPGRIDVVVSSIMIWLVVLVNISRQGFSKNSTDGTKLASLQIASKESKANSLFILNASNGDQPTAFNLVPDGNGTVSLMTMVTTSQRTLCKGFVQTMTLRHQNLDL